MHEMRVIKMNLHKFACIFKFCFNQSNIFFFFRIDLIQIFADKL